MLKNANSSVSEDEPMDYTEHSSVTHNPLTGLDTIIQAINKRYEVYQKRRTAITPFSTPAEASLGNPPTPRSIMGDSSMANASSGGGSGGSGTTSKQHSVSPAQQQQQVSSQPPRDPLAESIVAAHHHPAPYWEERELYIVAEDLCCYLNGGINYRLLCEQYQRALEVVLTLVKQDVALCASGAVEMVPGGTTRVMSSLQALLKESRQMLADAGVDLPPRLSTMLDQLPAGPEEQPFSDTPPLTLAGANAANSNYYVNGSSANSNANSGHGGPRSPRARPPSALAPPRRQPSANGVSVSVNDDEPPLSHEPAPPRVHSVSGTNNNNMNSNTTITSTRGVGGGSGRPPQPRNRTSISTPDTTHLPVHFSFSGNANSGMGSNGGVGGGSGGSGGAMTTGIGGPYGTGTRRNTPSSAVIVDPPVDGSHGVFSDTVNGMADASGNIGSTGAHERHSSILRNSISTTLNNNNNNANISMSSSAAPTPLSGAVTRARQDGAMGLTAAVPPPAGLVAQPPSEAAPASGSGGDFRSATPHREAERHTKKTTTTTADDSAMESVSPIPKTPPAPLYEELVADEHTKKNGELLQDQHTQQQQQHLLHGLASKDVDAAADQATQLRGRLRLLEELYGEHYKLDGMTLLTDALGVVFTREYDQGSDQQYQNGFTAFQRDVNNKVMPALKSYEALQLRITELTPLRSAYLASCLLRRVRPNDTVLDQLKRIDHDRSPEALLLGGLHLGDLGTAAVVESIVPRLYRLRTLNLSDNNVHDGVLELLLRSLRYHPALEILDLSRNPITDNGLPFLLRTAQTVPRLSSIYLQSSGMTSSAKQMIETELTTPGTYAVATPLVRRQVSASSLARTNTLHGGGNGNSNTSAFSVSVGSGSTGGVGNGVVVPVLSASAPRAPHPPTAHRPPSSLDGRNRWSPKSAARAESMPTKVSSAARKMMVSKVGNGSTSETRLPPLPQPASSPSHSK